MAYEENFSMLGFPRTVSPTGFIEFQKRRKLKLKQHNIHIGFFLFVSSNSQSITKSWTFPDDVMDTMIYLVYVSETRSVMTLPNQKKVTNLTTS